MVWSWLKTIKSATERERKFGLLTDISSSMRFLWFPKDSWPLSNEIYLLEKQAVLLEEMILASVVGWALLYVVIFTSSGPSPRPHETSFSIPRSRLSRVCRKLAELSMCQQVNNFPTKGEPDRDSETQGGGGGGGSWKILKVLMST